MRGRRGRWVVVLVSLGGAVAGGWGLWCRWSERETAKRPPPHAAVGPAASLNVRQPAPAHDPDAAPGTVSGIVRSPENAPLAGALVTLFPDVAPEDGGGARTSPAGAARTGVD